MPRVSIGVGVGPVRISQGLGNPFKAIGAVAAALPFLLILSAVGFVGSAIHDAATPDITVIGKPGAESFSGTASAMDTVTSGDKMKPGQWQMTAPKKPHLAQYAKWPDYCTWEIGGGTMSGDSRFGWTKPGKTVTVNIPDGGSIRGGWCGQWKWVGELDTREATSFPGSYVDPNYGDTKWVTVGTKLRPVMSGTYRMTAPKPPEAVDAGDWKCTWWGEKDWQGKTTNRGEAKPGETVEVRVEGIFNSEDCGTWKRVG